MKKEIVEFVDDLEEIEPESKLSQYQSSQAVIYNTDWTVETILMQLIRKNIDMPVFQRRDAWSKVRKSRYIESLILGLPVPQIILAEIKDNRGKYLVLDGKQRLLAILQFTGNDPGSENNNFKLQGLEILDDVDGKTLNGMTFEDINQDRILKSLLDPFNNQSVHAIIIRNWPSTSFLHMLFARLNTETLPLSPQELRQALFPGDFVKYADEASRNSAAIKVLLDLDEGEVDLRMRDVELLVRYLAFSFFLSDHPGNLKGFLDDTCKKLNLAWSDKQDIIKRQVSTFDDAVKAAVEIFGLDHVGRRWTGEDYSPRLNKAVLDVLNFYFSDDRIREAALANSNEVESAFKKLCLDSEKFRKSIETTTKSLGATSTRLILWGRSLKRATNLNFKLPILKDNKIRFTAFW